jgi:hypothetical protein
MDGGCCYSGHTRVWTKNPCLHLGPILAIASGVPSKFYVLTLHGGYIQLGCSGHALGTAGTGGGGRGRGGNSTSSKSWKLEIYDT